MRLPYRGARLRRWLTTGAVAAACWLQAPCASAFDLDGHFIIEAAAYKRLLALSKVPGADVAGRELLAALMAAGLLDEPPCFDGRRPLGSCGPRDRIERPLAFWPKLGSGAVDLIIDRQLSARAQCQHFMAETADALSAPDPRLGVPAALATTAYSRCVKVLGLAFDGLMRDPGLAEHRLVGMYALMHAIQDSFSAAHAARDEQGRIKHLLSWTLVDWPAYFRRGRAAFPADTHHGITDHRDAEYLRRDGSTDDHRSCADLDNPYALPESCLTPLAVAAVDAVADLLVLAYRIRKRATAAGREPSLSSPDDLALWTEYLQRHLASAAAAVEGPQPGQRVGLPRSDTFLGVQGTIPSAGWGAGVWGAGLFYGPAVPFALSVAAGTLFSHAPEGNSFVGAVGLGLYLPLVRRFAIGATPAGITLACDTSFDDCDAAPFATLGDLLVPLPYSTWLGLQGPRWSWRARALRGPLVGIAFGWAHESKPGTPRAADPVLVAAWDPPRPDDVVAYRSASTSLLLALSATAASTSDNQWLSGGIELRRDRDRWNRRAGLAPALSVAVTGGTIRGVRSRSLTVAPVLRVYLMPDHVWVALLPAAVSVEKPDGESVGVDVAGLLALGLIVGKLELSFESPRWSYTSREQRYALPFSVRLGLLFD